MKGRGKSFLNVLKARGSVCVCVFVCMCVCVRVWVCIINTVFSRVSGFIIASLPFS